MTDLTTRLRAHGLLAGLEESLIQAVADCAHETRFTAGTKIYVEGDEQWYFYLIQGGSVALQTASPSRPPATFQTLHEGDFVGVSWLASPYRCRFDALALTEVEAIAFDAGCLRGKCDADPTLGYALFQRFIPSLLERMETARLQALDLYREPS